MKKFVIEFDEKYKCPIYYESRDGEDLCYTELSNCVGDLAKRPEWCPMKEEGVKPAATVPNTREYFIEEYYKQEFYKLNKTRHKRLDQLRNRDATIKDLLKKEEYLKKRIAVLEEHLFERDRKWFERVISDISKQGQK